MLNENKKKISEKKVGETKDVTTTPVNTYGKAK
jgi:hypothetical protein